MASKRFATPDWAATPAVDVCLEVRKAGEIVDIIEIGNMGCYVMGRNQNKKVVDICVEHPTLSRQHAAIVHHKEGGTFIIDLRSGQGTFVNKKRAAHYQPVKLDDGVTFRLGQSTRIYSVRHSDKKAPPAPKKEEIVSKKKPSRTVGAPKPPPQWSEEPEEDDALRTALPMSFGKKAVETIKVDLAKFQRSVTEAAAASGIGASAAATGGEGDGDESGPSPFSKAPARQSAAAAAETARTRAEREAQIQAAVASFKALPKGELPSAKPVEEEEEEGSSGSEEEEGGAPSVSKLARTLRIPISHEAIVQQHNRAVTCLAYDPSGARLLTGSMDYDFRLYDFAGMNGSFSSFRCEEPQEGHPLVGASFSPTGGQLVVATGSAKARVYDRDGVELLTFVKGDPYLRDMNNTKGHVSALVGVQWHPWQRQTVLTGSWDGTLRVWDLNGKQTFEELMSLQIIKAKNRRGLRTGVTALCYNHDGSLLACGTQDGGIQVWNAKNGKYHRPNFWIREAHPPAFGAAAGKINHGSAGGELSCVRFSRNNNTLVSRSASDNCVKVWDLRQLKTAVKEIGGVATQHVTANMAFSGDGKLLLAGTAVVKGSTEPGSLIAMNMLDATTKPVWRSAVAPPGVSAVCVEWQPCTRQLAVGCSDGNTHLTYDPSISNKGVMLAVVRAQRRKRTMVDHGFANSVMDSVTYHPEDDEPLRDDPIEDRSYRKRGRDRRDPVKSKMPDMPVTGPGMGGRIGNGSYSFTQFMVSTMSEGRKRALANNEDPRDQMAKLARLAPPGEAGRYIDGAYTKNDPTRQLAGKTLEQEQEELIALRESGGKANILP